MQPVLKRSVASSIAGGVLEVIATRATEGHCTQPTFGSFEALQLAELVVLLFRGASEVYD